MKMDGGEGFDGFNDNDRKRVLRQWEQNRDGLWSDKVAALLFILLIIWLIV
jgi:hypothetical protein